MSLYQQLIAIVGVPSDRWQELAIYCTACAFVFLLCFCLINVIKLVTRW